MPVGEQSIVAKFFSSSLVPVEDQNVVTSSSSSSVVPVGGQNILAKPTTINTPSTTSRIQANTKNVIAGTSTHAPPLLSISTMTPTKGIELFIKYNFRKHNST